MPQRVNLNQDDDSVSNCGAGFAQASPLRSSAAEAWNAVKPRLTRSYALARVSILNLPSLV